jgi:hypothetical protein
MGEEDPFEEKPVYVPQQQITYATEEPEEPKHRAGHRNKKNLSDYLPYVILSLFAVAILSIVGYVMYEHEHAKPMIDTKNSMTIDAILDTSSSIAKQKEKEAAESSASAEKASSEKAASESKERETASSMSKAKAEEEAKKPKFDYGTMVGNRLPVSATNLKYPLNLTIEADQKVAVWAQVMVNGVSTFTQTIQPGDKQTIEITKEQMQTMPVGQWGFSYALGGAQNAKVTFNGAEIKVPAEYVSPVTVLVTMPKAR